MGRCVVKLTREQRLQPAETLKRDRAVLVIGFIIGIIAIYTHMQRPELELEFEKCESFEILMKLYFSTSEE